MVSLTDKRNNMTLTHFCILKIKLILHPIFFGAIRHFSLVIVNVNYQLAESFQKEININAAHILYP